MNNVCIIDVRSEREFKDGSIYGAINVPILNDKEREEVGYVYVNESISKAKKLGLRYAGYKLESLFDQVSSYFEQNKDIVFFCARGGMRSSTVHNLFNSIGIKNFKLDKGYKGYRKFVRDKFPEYLDKINFIVLHGKTGVGKTRILNDLKRDGYPVIDLEYAANHRASFLGGVNLGDQNSQKTFEGIVFHDLMEIIKNYSPSKNGKINVYVEGESKRIGKIILPQYLFDAMNNGVHICVDIPLDIRVSNLIEDYLKVTLEDIKSGIVKVDESILQEFKINLEHLRRYASKNEMTNYMDLLDNHDYEKLAYELIEKYYDPKYLNSMNKHEFKFTLECSSMNDFLLELKKVYDLI